MILKTLTCHDLHCWLSEGGDYSEPGLSFLPNTDLSVSPFHLLTINLMFLYLQLNYFFLITTTDV